MRVNFYLRHPAQLRQPAMEPTNRNPFTAFSRKKQAAFITTQFKPVGERFPSIGIERNFTSSLPFPLSDDNFTFARADYYIRDCQGAQFADSEPCFQKGLYDGQIPLGQHPGRLGFGSI